jgi:chitin synthase
MSAQRRTDSPPETTKSSQTTHLTSLIQQTGSSTIYPTEDDILAVLSSRTRADLPYTYLDGPAASSGTSSGGRALIVVNPLKSLGNLSDLNAKDYVDKYVDPAYVSSTGGKKKGKERAKAGQEEQVSRTAHLVGSDQPHLYDLAGKVWLLMQRRREDQAVLFR